MVPEVVRAVTGDSPRSVRARIEGYARYVVRGECYPAIVPQRGGATAGLLYLEVGDAALALLDRFEGELFVRRTVEVSLVGGERVAAETYILAGGHADDLTAEPWDESRFRRDDLEGWLRRCHAWRERGPFLLERETPLAALREAVDRAASGLGRIALVQGEAGIGKTSLVRLLADEKGGAVRFLWGACDALNTPTPLGPLRDMARQWTPELLRAVEESEKRSAIFTRVLDAIDQTAPLVLVFEDLHWADEATLDLLLYLGRRIEPLSALLLATFRDDEVGSDHPLMRVLGEWPQRRALRVKLEPLSAAGVARLSSSRASEAAEIHRVTGGNPFFVTELLADPSQGVPATVREAVLARWRRLSSGARELVDLVSVEPSRIERALLDRASAKRLDECVTLGVLRVEGTHVVFRHELARLCVLASLPPGRRRDLHARLLRVLLASPRRAGFLARIVHHAAEAGDTQALLEHAPAAAREAACVGSHREAAAFYRTAFAFADELAPRERAALFEAHAYECYLTSAIEEAVGSRKQALAIRRELGDSLGEGDNLRWLSRLSWFLASRSEAESFAEEAIDVLRSAPRTAEFAFACSNRAQLHMLAQEREETVRWGTRAAELAQELGELEILAHALNNVGTARLQAGDENGRADLERSLELSLANDLQEHAARAYTNLGSTAVEWCDYERARRTLDDGIAYAVERDLDSWSDYMRAWRARLSFERGAWDEAAEDVRAVLERPNAPAVIRLPAQVVLARLRVRRGDPGAAELLDEAQRLAEETRELQRLAPVAAARAEAAWLAGEGRDAAGVLQAAFDLARERGSPWVRGELSFWLARAGEPVGAQQEVAYPYRLALEGRWSEAAREWERLGRTFERADALAEGDEASLREALALFVGLGAVPAAERARARLRALGARVIPRGPRPSTRANPAGLTARQMEVLASLAEGLTYAQIARKLFLSAKTVEHHVAAILARLQASTRDEAVGIARRRGLLPPPDQDGGGETPR